MMPSWTQTRALSPWARLMLYELLAHGGDDLPGYWDDGLGLAGSVVPGARLQEVCGWLQELQPRWVMLGAQGQIWLEELGQQRMRMQRPREEDLLRWRKSIDGCADEVLRARILASVDATLRGMSGTKRLLKLWCAPSPSSQVREGCDLVARVVQMYETMLPQLPRLMKLTPKRAALIEQRLRDLEDESLGAARTPEDKLQAMRNFFARVARSDFLLGVAEGVSWRADLEWLMRPSNFLKVMEGRYDSRRALPARAGGYSEAFVRFMREYPVRVDVAKAWQVWCELGLDARIEDILTCLREDRMRSSRHSPMPTPAQYLRDQPWLMMVN